MASTAVSSAVLEDNTEYLYSIGGNYSGSKAPPTSDAVKLALLTWADEKTRTCLNRKVSGAGASTCIRGADWCRAGGPTATNGSVRRRVGPAFQWPRM